MNRTCRVAGVFVILVSSLYAAIPWLRLGFLSTERFPDSSSLPLGAEYFEICRSVSEGRGFSSPFRIESGPTSWMPPAIPVLLAGIYLLCERNEFAAAMVFYLIGTLCVTVAWLTTVRFDTSIGIGSVVALISFCVVLRASARATFVAMQDSAILMLLASLIMLGCHRNLKVWNDRLGCRQGIGAWSLLGGLVGLFSPSLLFSWIVCSIISLWRRKVHLAVALSIAASFQVPWLIRNLVQFRTIIPIKSNARFEAALAASRPTGLLDFDSFQHHPFIDVNEAQRHKELGEQRYIEVRSNELLAEAREKGCQFDVQVIHRAISFAVSNTTWIDFPIQVFLFVPTAVLCLLMMGLSKVRPSPLVCSLTVFISYGTPYIWISYYDRYSVPMIPVRAILLALGLQFILDFISANLRRWVVIFPWNHCRGSRSHKYVNPVPQGNLP